MIYLLSDLHLGHGREFIYKQRGFSSIEEHDEQIIENINSVVRPSDSLIIPGDLVVGDTDKGIEMLKRIQCQDVSFVVGNHDTDSRINRYESECGFNHLGMAYLLKYKKRLFYISHYPTLTANLDDDKNLWSRVYNICGHSHIPYRCDPVTNSYHVECEATGNMPISIEEIIDDLRRFA